MDRKTTKKFLELFGVFLKVLSGGCLWGFTHGETAQLITDQVQGDRAFTDYRSAQYVTGNILYDNSVQRNGPMRLSSAPRLEVLIEARSLRQQLETRQNQATRGRSGGGWLWGG